jgi:hypothetical protein
MDIREEVMEFKETVSSAGAQSQLSNTTVLQKKKKKQLLPESDSRTAESPRESRSGLVVREIISCSKLEIIFSGRYGTNLEYILWMFTYR